MSGLTADARVICKYMRNEALNFKLTYGSNQPINRLIFKVAESNTHVYNRIPTQDAKSIKKTIRSRSISSRHRQRRTSFVRNLSQWQLLRILRIFNRRPIPISKNLRRRSFERIHQLHFRIIDSAQSGCFEEVRE